MSPPILGTKIHAPPLRPTAVRRPSLIEQLDAGLQSRLILVSAPAGFGKTTLLSEWVAGLSRLEPDVRSAWLSLDEEEGDAALFVARLVAALRTADPDVGQQVLVMLQDPQPPPTETMLTDLINEISTLRHGIVLVLDDYHLVDSTPVDAALSYFLEHLPPQVHVVIGTREDPSLPLARWRAWGQLTELRAADLRFTPSEAAEFLNRAMGLTLSAEDVSALGTRTEGWIAGLQLAALSIQGRSDAAGFIRSFTGSHRFVLDYLGEEVLERQPEPVRTFLLRTAILDRLCGALCDAVTGQDNGQPMLERLERGNLFVVPLDEERHWYRYHRLFADFLRVQRLDAQADDVHASHRRASEWYEENGSRPDAIRHALCAEDDAWAAELIERAGPLVEDGSQAAAWSTWAMSLPDELIRARPMLSARVAYALLGRGEIEAAETRLSDAERWLDPGPSQPTHTDDEQLRSLLATISVGRAYQAHSLGDVPSAVKHAQRVLQLLPSGHHLRREQATALMGMTSWASGDLETADRVFADYSTRLLAAGNFPDAISATTVLADVRPVLGRLRGAEDALTRVMHAVVERGEPLPPDTAELYRGLGELALERGDLVSAAAHLLRSRELGERGELPDWRWRWCAAQARLDEAAGDRERALDMLDEAERLFVRTPMPNARPLSARRARIWVTEGRVAESLEWAGQRGLSIDDECGYLHEFEHLTLVRVLLARHAGDRSTGAVHGVASLLDRLLRAAEQGGRIGSVIEILALQALTYQALGDLPAALAPLTLALSLAEPEGYVQVFVDGGEPMARLLEGAASHAVAPDLAETMLAAFPSTRPGSHRSGVRSESGGVLSSREIEVLRLIAAGLTNREIAGRLFLSLYTVKAHARSIYDKVGAHSRTQAVASARALGILPLL